MSSITAPDGPTMALIVEARRGVLVTIGSGGKPRPVPFCYVARVDETGCLVLHTPIDEKHKRIDDPLSLARVRDIDHNPEVTVLIDRWNEDWTKLAWVRLRGTAEALRHGENGTSDERTAAIAALRAKYPQYVAQNIEHRPLIRIVVESWTGWSAMPGA